VLKSLQQLRLLKAPSIKVMPSMNYLKEVFSKENSRQLLVEMMRNQQ
jgi:hypothetical protein